MKKMLLILILVAVPSLAMAQYFIDEDFSGSVPPTGWTGDSHVGNWYSIDSHNAGGNAPELVFDWSPSFNGTTRLLSPRIDLTGITDLNLQFRYMVDWYATPFTIGVATRHGTSAWNVVWSRNPTGNVPATKLNVDINNADVGTSDFQICLYFTGNSENIDYWYVDDFILYSPQAHDVKVSDITIDDQYTPGNVMAPTAVIENMGLTAETVDITCDISLNGTSVYNNTVTGVSLDPLETADVTFGNYNLSVANDYFDVTVMTTLPGDMYTHNDTATTVFNTYTTERNIVMLEIGTGTWCQYCPGAAMGAEDLIENDNSVGVVEYHNLGGDPYQNDDGVARVGYYGITGYPTAVFDGVKKFVGGSNTQSMYSNYLPIYESRIGIKSAFQIEIFGTHTGDDYSLMIRATKVARIPWENMVLHVAITESGIRYNWQGQNHLEFVERVMVPSSDGTTLDFAGDEVQVIPLSVTLGSTWVEAQCEIAVWIQNLDGKEVLQGQKVMIPDLVPMGIDDQVVLPTETRLNGNYPNPFNPSTTIDFSLKAAGDVRLDVYNLLGQQVRTLVNAPMQAGNHSVVWDGKNSSGDDMASGLYFYKLSTDNYELTKKMSLLK